MRLPPVRAWISRWPLVLAALFGVYAYVLLANAYRSHDQLKAATDQRILTENKRQAATISDLVAARRNAAQELAATPEIAHFFTNRALGMSLRYGLGANLFAIEERFRWRQEKPDARGEKIFRRIILLDDAGHALVDTRPEDGPLPPIGGKAKEAKITVDSSQQHLIIVTPVIYRDSAAGSLVTVGDLATLSRDLLGTRDHSRQMEFLLSATGVALPVAGERNPLPADFLRKLPDLPENVLTSTAKFAAPLPARSLILRSAIPGCSLSLISIYSAESLYDQLTSEFFLYSASAFPLLLLLVILLFERTQRVKKALALSEQRFRIIVDNMRDAIVLIDPADRKVLEANPCAREIYADRQGKIVGNTAEALITPTTENLPAWEEHVADALHDRSRFFEWQIRRSDGYEQWLEINLLRANFNDRNLLLMVARDISRRKAQENELRTTLDAQTRLNKRLEEAQTQLLQSEKMASIGQLAAGVAHEINNPIGFVNSNLGTLQHYIDCLLKQLQAYDEESLALPDEKRSSLQSLRQELEIDYLRNDIEPLLRETQEGLERVRRIVADLKDFSHVDESEWQISNLERGLDSTINVVWNELKYKAELVKEYAGIPDIRCLASQLNQVFMNLLINAAHAIPEHGLITVRTGSNAENVWVEIEDNGTGIPEENLSRIFEPFFTTKPIGKGTGLGLSLAYGIIQKHQGKIEVWSQAGSGTRFRVTLPLHAKE